MACTLALAAAACTRTGASVEAPEEDFPEPFLMGAATAGFQVEMGCPTLPEAVCADKASDWYAYVTSEEMASDPVTHLTPYDPNAVGPGHWETYEQDYDLAATEVGLNAFRMGIEWSRIFPTSTEGVEGHEALRAIANADAVATYRAMFEAMRERGLTPVVTIHHYTLPAWIHDGIGCHKDFAGCTDRGWLQPERIIPEISKLAGFVAREYGDLVDLWFTQNEPFAVILPGYLQTNEERSNPPAVLLQASAARTALLAMIEAHARMVDAVRASDTTDADGDGSAATVGLVYAMAPVLPADPADATDLRAVNNIFYLWNLLFLDATAAGWLDDDLDGTAEHRPDLAGRLDIIGLNYKMSMRIEGTERSLLPALSPLLTMNPTSVDLSQVQPRGLYEMVDLLEARYGLPVLITENNGRALWDGDVETELRRVTENLQWCAHALDSGLDLRGWIYWAFMDNIEWNHGMDVGLGLYAVDPEDPQKRRTPRATVPLLAAITANGGVPEELRSRYPVDLDEGPTGGVPEVFRAPPPETGWRSESR